MPEISPRNARGGVVGGSSRGQSSRGTKKGTKQQPQRRVEADDGDVSMNEDEEQHHPSKDHHHNNDSAAEEEDHSPMDKNDDDDDDDDEEAASTQKGKKGKTAKPKAKAKAKAKRTFTGVRAPPKRDRMSVHKRLNLYFPVGRIGRYLKKGRYSKRIGATSPVFLAAVLDYMVGELIEISCETARDNKKSTVKPRHIQLAIQSDAEFLALLKNVMITQGGTHPHIEPFLLQKRQLQPRKSKKVVEEKHGDDDQDEDEEMVEPENAKPSSATQDQQHSDQDDDESDAEYESGGEGEQVEDEEEDDEEDDDDDNDNGKGGEESQEFGEE